MPHQKVDSDGKLLCPHCKRRVHRDPSRTTGRAPHRKSADPAAPLCRGGGLARWAAWPSRHNLRRPVPRGVGGPHTHHEGRSGPPEAPATPPAPGRCRRCGHALPPEPELPVLRDLETCPGCGHRAYAACTPASCVICYVLAHRTDFGATRPRNRGPEFHLPGSRRRRPAKPTEARC